MLKKEPNMASLVISIITLVIGVVLCFNDSDGIFSIIGYIVSGLLILSGIIKFVITHITNKKTNNIDFSGIISSLALFIIGILVYIFPKSVIICRKNIINKDLKLLEKINLKRQLPHTKNLWNITPEILPHRLSWIELQIKLHKAFMKKV